MFSGLIEDIGEVERLTTGGVTDLWVASRLCAEPMERGDSIAVDGVCLTVVELNSKRFRVQAAPETLRRTTLGNFRPGTKVNLERALRFGDRLGGHLVQGHVDAVSRIVEAYPEGDSLVMSYSLPAALAPFLIEKGSVAVDGISLTVTRVSSDAFSVMLIPETRLRTTLASKKPGEAVNLEADLIGKYIERLYRLGRSTSPISTTGGT
jgi:riboflavin synthase